LGVRYWVIVKAPRYPERNTNPPSNITDIKESNSLQEGIGYLASVTVASADDPFDPREKGNGNFAPLYRGHPMLTLYAGLKEI
jgi:hypothetical protein